MRRAAALLVLAALAAMPASASAAGEWVSQQPVSALGSPAEIGEIGDIEFWAPNRGMLITAGNAGVPAGLFAYDGTGWYRYSNVCGGHEGRIAWAGPDEFWTISDQQVGQENGLGPAQHVSLCHFVNGVVAASYAEPVGVAESYLPMDAAACSGPSDCWFAGERLPGTINVGAFHLHWDGATLSPVPSLVAVQPAVSDPGRSVTSLAYHEGALHEGVKVREGDVAPGEPKGEPSVLHQIFPGGGPAFVPLYTEQPIAETEALSEALSGPHLTGDAEELWGILGTDPESGRTGAVTALRLGEAGFEQVSLKDTHGAFAPGDRVGGAAAEPGGAAVWVGFSESGDFAASPTRVTKIHADGTVDAPSLLSVSSPITPLGQNKGPAGPIACPAAGQCWLGTVGGWLFHLGPNLPKDTDPAMHVLVTFRPPDASLTTVSPTELPEDNSGAEEEKKSEAEAEPFPSTKKLPPLYSHVKSHLIGRTLLEMTFQLNVSKAKVRLVAERKGKVVAQTPRYTMKKGDQKVRLRLDPDRWPTKLDLQVKQIKKGKSS